MDLRELAKVFLAAFNAGDWDTVASHLDDSFQFTSPVTEPSGAQEWLGVLRIYEAAFPDINYNLRLVGIEGNVITTTSQPTGTHTGDLDLTAMGMGVIPATGESFSLPEQQGEVVIKADKVASIEDRSVVAVTGLQLREILEHGASALPDAMGFFAQASQDLVYTVDTSNQAEVLSANEEDPTEEQALPGLHAPLNDDDGVSKIE